MTVQAHQWARAKAIAKGLLARAADWDESLHPRDEGGKWVGGGGGGGGGGGAGPRDEAGPRDKESLDPVVTETSGGQWSKNTAIRLEMQYQAARPKLEALTPEGGLPKQFDPLKQTSDASFEDTQSLAHYLSVQRADQIIKERGITEPTNAALASAHTKLWTAWSDSSSTTDGQLLQVAVAEELGGRLRTGRNSPIDTDMLKSYADKQYKNLGGYEGVKGYVRAKWEVTQYLLDKAGIKELQLFRSIELPPEQLATATEEPQGKFTKLPGVAVVRNGAASTSVDPKVANKWGKGDTRVVLRALVPRTAAVSLPVYGLLPEDLKEVVIAGTAWKAWDAWRGEAPDFTTHPMEWSP